MMDDASFAIDTLNLRLPAGYGHRAEFIAREVGRELSRLPLQHDVRLPAIDLPKVQVYGGESDRVIAQRIAQAIHQQVFDRHVAADMTPAGGHSSEPANRR